MEPRTPLKRQRIPVQRFQSPLEEQEGTKGRGGTPTSAKEDVAIAYKKNVYLAVRGAEGRIIFSIYTVRCVGI